MQNVFLAIFNSNFN